MNLDDNAFAQLSTDVAIEVTDLSLNVSPFEANRLSRALYTRGVRSSYMDAPVVPATASRDQQVLAVPGVVEYLVNGKKIQAIKALRDTYGWELKEAKDAVEAGLPGRIFNALPSLEEFDQKIRNFVLMGEQKDRIIDNLGEDLSRARAREADARARLTQARGDEI